MHTSMIPLRLSLVAVVAVVGAACTDPVGDAPRAEVKQAAPSEPQKAAAPVADGAMRYVFSQEGSRVDFVGAKVTRKHDGGFKILKGTIDVPKEGAAGAKVDVEIDVSSVWTDTEKLTGHLLSPDFFDVAKFPTARFVSTQVTPAAGGASTITGELTMHGVTKQISFPATVQVAGDSATAKAEFGINRKDFGIVYPGAPDDLINDEVLLKLDITAKPQG